MAKSLDAVVGLDIGTSKVAVVAGIVQEGMVQVVGVGSAPNSGLRKGVIVDIEDTVSAISGALEEAERSSGMQLQSAFVGISGTQVTIHDSKGVVAVSRADGEIAAPDIERVLEAARVVAVPANKEILHVVPLSYAVDGQRGIKDPNGMTGIRLEVDAQIIAATTSAYRNQMKCVEQAGLQAAELVFSPLATAKTMLSKKQRENGVVMIDIGAGTTSLVVFEEGDMIHAAVLPVGSMHITNDIAIGLRISLDAAEKIKLKYGAATKEAIKENETIPLSSFEPDEKERIERKYLVDIIEARLNELFGMVRDELKKIGKDSMLPAGAIITGGGSQLEGLLEFAKGHLHLPASTGNPLLEVAGLVDELDNPGYATALGLMLWGLEATQTTPKGSSRLELHKVSDKLIDRARHIFDQFLP